MMKSPADFKNPQNNTLYYSLFDDWGLIEASFNAQYGIRLRKDAEGMTWNEFATLLSGIAPDTPLGNIVSIRAEKDPKVLKQFNAQQRKIHRDWAKKQAADINMDDYKNMMNQLQDAFKTMAGGDHEWGKN
ncbi:Bacteriophage Gp15 protein [Eubacterium aggregans]|uniref:Bacteriophage Gp15 protein n=1 Tax=Eubacterium aggregans TaxID=81409 RepID=A0A1H3Y2Z5_9FIRM|nr:Gp15 family bacteriophage protein [Eubacterium aggregans]SEA06095.1 Bacteriophage Gp15 protein [Eubacterium aggregans]